MVLQDPLKLAGSIHKPQASWGLSQSRVESGLGRGCRGGRQTEGKSPRLLRLSGHSLLVLQCGFQAD